MTTSSLAIPMKLDAFVLNPDACGSEGNDTAKIAPITQPNYSYLRMEQGVLQPDVLDPIPLYNAAPSERNSRVTNLADGKPRENRLGVYLHWMIPRPYRAGQPSKAKTQSGDETEESDAPVFPLVPNRWLVVRCLRTKKPEGEKPEDVVAWVVESDRMRLIDDEEFETADLQTDASPFIQTTKTTNTTSRNPAGPQVDKQAEIFIGKRTPVTKWREETDLEELKKKSVALTVLNSSNTLFPDYQPHNTNVFSIIDTFDYQEYDGNKWVTKYLTDATADYFVIGWHGQSPDDLLNLSGEIYRRDYLQSLGMSVPDDKLPQTSTWLDCKDGGRVVCHGAMYDVQWHRSWTEDNKPKVRADEIAHQMATNTPVAIGTTPLDALLTYVEANHADEVAKDLYAIASLLRAQSETIEDRRAGADEVQNYNFGRGLGGTRYVNQVEKDNPAAPPNNKVSALLNSLNQSQQLLDAVARQKRQLQSDTFSVFWKYLTDKDQAKRQNEDLDHKLTKEYKKQVGELKNKLNPLSYVEQQQLQRVKQVKDQLKNVKIKIKAATLPETYQQLDPTLFLAGVEAGWPHDYREPLRVRLDFQIPPARNSDPLDKFGVRSLPLEVREIGVKLLHEFLDLRALPNSPSSVEPPTYPPLYHENGRDRWDNQQPWFPLFVEWEAEYYHIPFDKWETSQYATRSNPLDRKYRYTIRQGLSPLWEHNIEDSRIVSGRILLLPQPTFSLQAQLAQLFNTTPKAELDKILDKAKRDKLLKAASTLPYISGPLDGFTDHLLTWAPGNHLKPNIRYPGRGLSPLQEAVNAVKPIDMKDKDVEFMGAETGRTPYASQFGLEHDDIPAFKPVTHGQFKLTSLNIVDKFGQAVCVVDPERLPNLSGAKDKHHPIYPYISDYYAPQEWQCTSVPNVVEKPDPEKPTANQFVQVPPAINQLARLNMDFVELECSSTKAKWRPISEWENPIWGWVIVNHVDHGLQFFLPDGTFYREVRIAGPNHPDTGSATSARWLPFAPSSKTSNKTTQMDRLIQQITHADSGNPNQGQYLLQFIGMVSEATSVSKSAPSAYSECLNSLVGRPLAMVNVGVSIELSEDARRNQSTLGKQKTMQLPFELLKPGECGQYTFPVKLGDKARPHDGLVGYFPALSSPVPDNALQMDQLFTYYADAGKDIIPIEADNFPRIKPFWVDPGKYSGLRTRSDFHHGGGRIYDSDSGPGIQAEAYAQDRNNNMTVMGMLMDPFLAVHAYSSILPISSLKLAPWTWETALKQMKAFFHFGPLIIPGDVPEFDCKKELTVQRHDEGYTKNLVESSVQVPTLPVTEWAWLQPYNRTAPCNGTDHEKIDHDNDSTHFMALKPAKTDPRPKYEPGPMTAVEGYMEMLMPIAQKHPPAQGS